MKEDDHMGKPSYDTLKKEQLAIIKEFEEKFIASQVEMPEDFKKILNDNLWELYEE